jgi:hypothetical protein
MPTNSESWKKRADEIIAGGPMQSGAPSVATQFATSMLTALYGAHSQQLVEFQAGCERITKTVSKGDSIDYPLWNHAYGTILNARAELEAGLIENMRFSVAGEVLVELVRVGKEILEDKTDEAKNVGAVLIAAAYEGTLRRMGEEFAGVTDRVELQTIITALKDKGVLKGADIGIAQGYLKFRNDSLHADWEKVERSQVQSCLALVESQLEKHFS